MHPSGKGSRPRCWTATDHRRLLRLTFAQSLSSKRGVDMWWGVGIIGLIIWIAIAFWPARVAGRKGHSFLGYFILSLFFFPLALILAYVVRDRRGLYVRA